MTTIMIISMWLIDTTKLGGRCDHKLHSHVARGAFDVFCERSSDTMSHHELGPTQPMYSNDGPMVGSSCTRRPVGKPNTRSLVPSVWSLVVRRSAGCAGTTCATMCDHGCTRCRPTPWLNGTSRFLSSLANQPARVIEITKPSCCPTYTTTLYDYTISPSMVIVSCPTTTVTPVPWHARSGRARPSYANETKDMLHRCSVHVRLFRAATYAQHGISSISGQHVVRHCKPLTLAPWFVQHLPYAIYRLCSRYLMTSES